MSRHDSQSDSWSAASRNAFTLIEVLIVLTILALLSALTVASVRQPIARARQRLTIDSFLLADQQLRTLSRRESTSYRLVLDRAAGRISRQPVGQANGMASTSVAAGVKVDELRRLVRTDAEVTEEIRFFGNGSSESYAFRVLSGPQESVWVIVAGGTGQAYETTDVGEVGEIAAQFGQP